MIPVVTPEHMGEIDRAAPEGFEVLVGRAAAAVRRAAVELLGGTYGRRVAVLAGPGNNGEDGRVAAAQLRARGVRVDVLDALEPPERVDGVDLVIDAAFGTGFRGSYEFPDVDAPVLSVDIPSGVSGLTGVADGVPPRAAATVCFAALKPGLLLADGPGHTGRVTVVDIGLDVSSARAGLVEDADVVGWVPRRAVDAHKWRHAVWIVAGSRGMSGAAHLAADAALRAGAGYVRLSVPGDPDPSAPLEAVTTELPTDWADTVADGAGRFAALLLGPGLGRSDDTATQLRAVLARLDAPVVLDGDALTLLGADVVEVVADRSAPTVLTPHDGEFDRLTGAAPPEDRLEAARSLATSTGAVVLLKGPTTVVADPAGDVLLTRTGDQRLATAGTGDVLSGIVLAHLALGADPLRAAAAAAHVHGRAAELGPGDGLVASDLPSLVTRWWGSAVDRTPAAPA